MKAYCLVGIECSTDGCADAFSLGSDRTMQSITRDVSILIVVVAVVVVVVVVVIVVVVVVVA